MYAQLEARLTAQEDRVQSLSYGRPDRGMLEEIQRAIQDVRRLRNDLESASMLDGMKDSLRQGRLIPRAETVLLELICEEHRMAEGLKPIAA